MTEFPALELDERRALANNALATMRLEGLEPHEQAKELIERYVSGMISEEDLFNAIERLLGPGQPRLASF